MEKRKTAVENPATKILDAMSLNLKTPSYKSVTRSNPSGVREAVDNLNDLVAAILSAIDVINARLDALENCAPVSASLGAGADLQPDQEVADQ